MSESSEKIVLHSLIFIEETNDNILLYFLSIFFVCIDMYFENRLCWIHFLEICYFYMHIISIFVLCQMFFHSFIFHGLVIVARSKQFCDYPTAGHVNCTHFLYYQLCCSDILRNTSFPIFKTTFLEIQSLSQTINCI